MVCVPSSSAPALKSIQCGFRVAMSVFDDTLIVGTGKPSGVPRPVVKRSGRGAAHDHRGGRNTVIPRRLEQ